MGKPIIEYRNVDFGYQNKDSLNIHNISFSVKEGEFITILGSSGSGKTTLIKMANRLLDPCRGEILFDGQDSKEMDVLELRRQMGYVIQQIGLFPHMTIAENIGIVPQIMGWDKIRIKKRVEQLLELVQLPVTDEFKRRHPWQLSGGQQQRVGIARALSSDPRVLLMDEPFGALDVVTRKELQRELKNMHSVWGKTILFVTHDLQEAIELGDKVLIIREGNIEQFDTPKNIVLCPSNEYVKGLFGAATPLEKMMYFKVKDFKELLHKDDEQKGAKLEWEDSMQKVLNRILLGDDKVSVYRGENYMGCFLQDDLQKIGEMK